MYKNVIRHLGATARPLALSGPRPATLLFASFAAAIATGTLLLMLPAAAVEGRLTAPLDALFTATSAVCVTGLTVQDTATHFSIFGQCVILALIQAGGLGIMTFSAAVVLILGRPLRAPQESLFRSILDQDVIADTRRLLRYILRMTLFVEGLGAAALTAAWWGRFPPAQTLYHAVFHSISAFCNAGFSTWSENLTPFAGEWFSCGVIGGLIVIGGIGFAVVNDIHTHVRHRIVTGRLLACPLRAQSRIVLRVTALLIVAGAVLIGVLEWNAAFAGRPVSERILLSLFQSITARTAGFNTANIGALGGATVLVLTILMFIGASPGSTGGGVKTTSVAILLASARCGLRRRAHVEMCRRTVPMETIQKAMAVCVLGTAVVVLGTLLLLRTETQPFENVLFEAVSAFGTVGLSRGLTPNLTPYGKACVCLLMFAGRLGPLTIAIAFLRDRSSARYMYAEESIMVG